MKANTVKRMLLIFSLIIGVTFFAFIATCTIFYNKYDLDIAKLTSLNNGINVYSLTGTNATLCNSNRSIVKLENLPKYVPQAFVDIEDKRFYKHSGYDLKRIFKAGLVNLSTRSKSQGASTISQQLIKNALLSNEKTYSRKIKELVLAIKLEKQFSKQEILEMYLNTIYFGSNAFGIENASKIYFNKSASQLSINEACCLAGIIKSPNKYSPKTNLSNSIQRRNLVAKTMKSLGNISNEDFMSISNSSINVLDNTIFNNSYEKLAILEACNLLNVTERELINNNYSIITYKDDLLQSSVAEINKNILTNDKKLYNTNLDGLSMVINNNGKVVAYYENSHYNLNNLSRQPASLIKPLAVYLPCLAHNILTPASKILDEPINYSGYSPNNADNKFHGYVSVRDSLAHSYNIPAVKALDYAGLINAKQTLQKFDIFLKPNELNLSLALGCTENGINLIKLASAYSVLANMGVNKGLAFVYQILDKDGNKIYSSEDYSEQLFSDEDCFLLTDMLKDSVKIGTAKRLNSLNIPIASKTGSASVNGYNTDVYNVAYTTEHTVFSWIGNLKDNKLAPEIKSSVQPTQINKEILQYLYSNYTPKDFVKPDGVEKFAFDLIEQETSNLLVSPSHNIERYIAYDFFKTSNPPKDTTNNISLCLDVEVLKNGAKLSFNTIKNLNYKLVKQTENQKEIIAEISNKSGLFEVIDSNIFQHDKIEYYVLNDIETSKIIEINPKNFLINLLNNEILNGKKKWLV